MATIEVKIKVQAANVLQAETLRQGIQNVVDELTGYEEFMEALADKAVAKQYRQRLDSIMKNPLFKTLAARF